MTRSPRRKVTSRAKATTSPKRVAQPFKTRSPIKQPRNAMYRQFDDIPYDYRHSLTLKQKEEFLTNNDLFMKKYEEWRINDLMKADLSLRMRPNTAPIKPGVHVKEVDFTKKTTKKTNKKFNDAKDWRYYGEWNNNTKKIYKKL